MTAWEDSGNELDAVFEDGLRLASLAHFEAIAINAWLVQARKNGVWYSAYFATPPSGTPHTLHASKLDALRAAIDAASGVP